MMKLFIFDRVTDMKKGQTLRKLYSLTYLPTATSSMINKGKQIRECDSSNSKFSPGLKRVLIEPEGVPAYSNQEESHYIVRL